MFLQVGLLGHILTLELTVAAQEEEPEETAGIIGGGSGGSFERFEEPLEYYESEEWEDRRTGFGFS